MEKEILKKIGDNKTKEKTFYDKIFIDEPKFNEILGFYTYKKEVCILDGFGMDVAFSSYSEKNKKTIYDAIMLNKYK